jgi:hypothetical protein
MFADWIQTFPVLAYLYTSKPTTDLIPESEKEAKHGLSLQFITPIVVNPQFFMQVTPIYSNIDLGTSGSGTYIQEFLAQYAIMETLQVSGFYRGVFSDNDHTIRFGLVIYLI